MFYEQYLQDSVFMFRFFLAGYSHYMCIKATKKPELLYRAERISTATAGKISMKLWSRLPQSEPDS